MEDLRPPTQRVSPRAPYLWAVEALIRTLLLLAAALGAQFLGLIDLPSWVWPVYGAAALAYVLGMPVFRFRVHRWEATESAVYTQTGWLTRERRIAPMARVQTVDFEQGALDRLFGLASVTVTTASAAGPLAIEALDEPLAQHLIDELTRRAGEGDDAT